MIACVILFGGRGNRFQHSEPKQYFQIGGKSLLVHCLESICKVKLINQIIIVCEPQESERVRDLINGNISFDKGTMVRLCDAGPQRSDSVFNGLQACHPQTQWVLIHDGARAFCPPALIDNICNEVLVQKTGIIPVLPCVDSIVEINGVESNQIKKSLKRETLYRVQTPQGFAFRDIYEAYRDGIEAKFQGTDCSSYALRAGQMVMSIAGSEYNFKVTRPEDIQRAIQILAERD